jgi:protein O-mannosyl-transferase
MSIAKGQPPENFIDAGKSSLDDRRATRLILCLLLVLVTIALYSPVSRAPYLNYDDNAYVYENYHVRQGLTWQTISWAFTTTDESNWHPLTWLSHALDVDLFGLKPAGPHYMNVLLHAANVALLFLFLQSSTGMVWRSACVAFLFAVHPLNVESVAWISERKNVLSMFFFLLALLAYAAYASKSSTARYMLVAVSFALALMAKPQVITLPFVLLLLDYWPLQRTPGSPENTGCPPRRAWSRLILEKIPLLALSTASAWITMRVQHTAMQAEYPFSVRLENALVSYATYIGKTLVPVRLAPMYPHPGFSVRPSSAFLAALLLIVITVAVAISRRRYLLVGWLWFLGVLVPMMGFVQVGLQAMADRYAYIPLIGLLIMICWGAGDLMVERSALRISTFAAGAAVAIALTIAAYRQIGYWKDNLTLWTHTLEVTRNNFIAEDSLATALLAEGRIADAAVHFQNAVHINPEDPIGTLNLGAWEQLEGNDSAAIAYDQSVLRLTQNSRVLTQALTNLGYIYYTQKQYESSRQSFEIAVQQMPQNAQAWVGLGLLAQKSGNLQRATQDYENAIRFELSDVEFLLFAQALEKQGLTDQAAAARASAARYSHDIDAANRDALRLLQQ